MKKRLLAALAATALLTGCSAAATSAANDSEPATSSSTPAPSPTPTAVAGETVRGIADPDYLPCEATTAEIEGLSYLETCNGGILTMAELEPGADRDAFIAGVLAWADDSEAFYPWVVGESWMIQAPEVRVTKWQKEHKGSVIMRSPGAPVAPNVQLKKMMSATAKATNTKCATKKTVDLEYGAIAGAGCKLPNGDFYTLMYVFEEGDGLEEIQDEQGEFFTMVDHDAFSVEGQFWYVHDVKQSEAKKIAKILDGEVINLNANA